MWYSPPGVIVTVASLVVLSRVVRGLTSGVLGGLQSLGRGGNHAHVTAAVGIATLSNKNNNQTLLNATLHYYNCRHVT